MNRRFFIKLLASASAASHVPASRAFGTNGSSDSAAHIPNHYYLFLPGEREALESPPLIESVTSRAVTLRSAAKRSELAIGQSEDGWNLVTIVDMNGTRTAVFEKRTSHRGSIAYVTVDQGVIAQIPTFLGDIANIRPRPVTAPLQKRLKRGKGWTNGPDVAGDYILHAFGDPSWESVAALGEEFIGWNLVANEQAGPERSLFLQPDGTSREINNDPAQGSWAPDQLSPVIDPRDFFPSDNVHVWKYEDGFSKRTLFGGYTPTANLGVWNKRYGCGYELSVLLPDGEDAIAMSRCVVIIPEEQLESGVPVRRDHKGRAFVERYKGCDAGLFFSTLAGIWNHWHTFFETSMPVHIPDENLLDSARAGIMLSRCSYRGLRPTYQIGEGAYTKIPERSHALFPVAQYEFIWAHQVWGLTRESDPYFQYYLDHYILPDGNFQYNVQDQVEAPLTVGFLLRNAARGYLYRRDIGTFKAQLPVLDRMLAYVVERYRLSKRTYPSSDPHHGLMWGSPEADLGEPHNDYPNAHPYYYQNAAGVWRGIADFAGALDQASQLDSALAPEATRLQSLADEMRTDITRSLALTMSRCNDAMKRAGITPFTPEDTRRDPKTLSSYENHRFMQDWFLADWGDPVLDAGHLLHRTLSGMQWAGLHMDGTEPRTSNFMEHGTLSVKIRQDDYRSFLLTLYALIAFAADTGNRYSPEDALVPGGAAGEGQKYSWSATVNSVLQPTLGLRWLLCYEESDKQRVHLQKAAPCHWFAAGLIIAVERCPTRFGLIAWKTIAKADAHWSVSLDVPLHFEAELILHLHPPGGKRLISTSAGVLQGNSVVLSRDLFASRESIQLEIRASSPG